MCLEKKILKKNQHWGSGAAFNAFSLLLFKHKLHLFCNVFSIHMYYKMPFKFCKLLENLDINLQFNKEKRKSLLQEAAILNIFFSLL